jgi:hypothetical protein
MGLVAKPREFHRRHLFRRAAGFLQKHQIGLLPFQKARDMGRARTDGIDVEGNNAEQGISRSRRKNRSRSRSSPAGY